MNNDEHLGNLLTETSNRHFTAFYTWIRFIITLASGLLTLLVGLHKLYISQDSNYIIFLKLSWICLLLTIIIGLIALYGESQVLFDLSKNLKKYRDLPTSHQNNKTIGVSIPRVIRYAQITLPFLFSFSLIFLVLFAFINL